MVMEDQVIDLVLERSAVNERPAGFYEIMNPKDEG
jgi:hypothetical protein